MTIIDQIPDVLLWLIRAGVATRLVYCLIRMAADGDDAAMYKRRMRNALIFYAIAESAMGLKDIIISVFS